MKNVSKLIPTSSSPLTPCPPSLGNWMDAGVIHWHEKYWRENWFCKFWRDWVWGTWRISRWSCPTCNLLWSLEHRIELWGDTIGCQSVTWRSELNFWWRRQSYRYRERRKRTRNSKALVFLSSIFFI